MKLLSRAQSAETQWTEMHSSGGVLTLGVRINGHDGDLVFAGRDLDDLRKHVISAVAQRRASRARILRVTRSGVDRKRGGR